jgi:uncharacterized protein YbjQ (UPF0145 family)
MNQKPVPGAAYEPGPAISMQPSIEGQTGQPIGVVMAEVVCMEQDENDLFAGLRTFIRGELPAQRTSTDIALEKLLRELRRKGRGLGADAILSTTIKLLRGADSTGQKLLKMSAIGTAVALPSRKD